MAIKLFGNDNGTVREVKKLFGNDNGTVRTIKKLFALDGSTVRLIYQSAKTFLLGGAANVVAAGHTEVVEFGLDNRFEAGDSSSPASFSISNTSENIPEITGNFTAEGDVTQGLADIKAALENDSSFTSAWDFTGNVNIPAVSSEITFTFGEWPDGETFVAESFFIEGSLPVIHTVYEISPNITISSTEELVDAIVSVVTPVDGYSATKLSASSVSLNYHNGTNGLTRGISFEGQGSSSTVLPFPQEVTEAGLTIDDQSALFFSTALLLTPSGFPPQGSPARTALEYTAKTTGDFEDFTFAITENNGEITNPYLNVSTEGSDIPVPATVITITNPNESVSLSSGIMDDDIGAAIAAASTDITYDDTDVSEGGVDYAGTLTTPSDTTITISNGPNVTIVEQ